MVNMRLGFTINLDSIKNGIFLPKYYDPIITNRLTDLVVSHNLVSIGELVESKQVNLTTGNEVGKMAYGTGDIPFIRTSDIANGEIKTHPKQGVSEDVYSKYKERQDVQEGDLFLVRDGTYLIGQSCIVGSEDLPCLYQSHIIKIRVKQSSPIDTFLFFACLNSPIVRQQIRSIQFTADIIDTIGNRILEVVLPIPKDKSLRQSISNEIRTIGKKRNNHRIQMKKVPLWAEGVINNNRSPIPKEWKWRAETEGSLGFKQPLSKIAFEILIPKYYNPHIDEYLHKLKITHNLVALSDLIEQGILEWDTGIEIGKMAYGTGRVPFIRTSDISNWELKGDPKQGISTDIYQTNKQDVQTEDIFVVRDGTYLVGTSAIITEHDSKLLYCGGLYKLRIKDKSKLDPYLFLALLNTPIVHRQMRSKQFTRDIIDTLGKRLFEVKIPIPKNKKTQRAIAKKTREIIETRVRLRDRARQISLDVEGASSYNDYGNLY